MMIYDPPRRASGATAIVVGSGVSGGSVVMGGGGQGVRAIDNGLMNY